MHYVQQVSIKLVVSGTSDEEEFKKAENDSAAEANTENINAKNPNVEKLRNPGHSGHSSYSFI